MNVEYGEHVAVDPADLAFDASAALAGLPFEGHLPADCRPGCPKWTDR